MITDYIFQLGLPQLEKKGDNWNFRCVVCGDSKKNPNKKRGWIFTDKNLYYCYNCGIGYKFSTFLKKFYYHIYLDYIKDRLKHKKSSFKKPKKIVQQKKKYFLFKIIDPFYSLIKNTDVTNISKKEKFHLNFLNFYITVKILKKK